MPEMSLWNYMMCNGTFEFVYYYMVLYLLSVAVATILCRNVWISMQERFLATRASSATPCVHMCLVSQLGSVHGWQVKCGSPTN